MRNFGAPAAAFTGTRNGRPFGIPPFIRNGAPAPFQLALPSPPTRVEVPPARRSPAGVRTYCFDAETGIPRYGKI